MSEIRDELEATLEARAEMGKQLEPQLVEQFVDRLEKEIDRRIDKRLAERRPGRHAPMPWRSPTPMVLGSLLLAIPLIGAAGATAGSPGVLFVCLAIVLLNAMGAKRG